MTYNYYRLTDKHLGNFPNLYWCSPRVPLYGCEGVHVSLRIYPTGDGTSGEVSAYIYLHCDDPSAELNIKCSLKLLDFHQQFSQAIIDNKNTIGWGWTGFCNMKPLFQVAEVPVEFTVTVLQFKTTKQNHVMVTRPEGTCQHLLTSTE